jgi:glycosyltransferase involved in cell wall biosynthesis
MLPYTLQPESTVTVVVPVFNSEGSLDELVTRLEAVLSLVTPKWDITLVNDGSRDQSWQVIEGLVTKHDRVRGINLMRNFGQHNALLAGIRQAQGKYVVTLDDDLQNPPEEIPNLLAKLAEGFDVVYGTPQQEQHGFLRDQASRITKIALQGAMGAETACKVSAFRAFRTQLRVAFKDYDGPFVSIDVLLTWGTTLFSSVQVSHAQRLVGVSNYTFRKLVVHALNMMTGFSVLPLQVASWMGFSFTAFGLLVLAFVLGRFILNGGSVSGFPFLASIIAIFSGVQLFTLGIFGEYLARMYSRTMGRPTYVVRESLESNRDK